MVIFGQFLAWPWFVWGMAVGGCSTAEALSKYCLSTANHVQLRVGLKIGLNEKKNTGNNKTIANKRINDKVHIMKLK